MMKKNQIGGSILQGIAGESARMKLSCTVASIGFVHTKPAAVSRKGKIPCDPCLKTRRKNNEKQKQKNQYPRQRR